jgi:hypothetical protein
MSDNPLDPGPEHEAHVAELARKLWHEDGEPEGREADYRERADELVRMTESGRTAQLPAEAEPIVEEASIQDNLGEIPGRQTDQGEERQTPMSREDMRKQQD